MQSINFTLYPELKLLHFKGSGKITYEMIIEEILQVHQHPDWQFDFNTFIDFEDAEVIADYDAYEKYSQFFAKLQENTPSRKWALYTLNSQTHSQANMSHLLQSMSIEVDVFLRHDDALEFLGIDPQIFNEVKSKIL